MKRTRVMKTTRYIFVLALVLGCTAGNLFAVEKSYYHSLDGKSGTALREELTSILYTHHTTDVGYDWTFDGIDIVNGEILDIYSTCTRTSAQQGKNYSNVCDAYNREHLVPQSLFNEKAPQVSDRHHLFLADGLVNGLRSSYPFGETNTTNAFSSYSNGNKALGKLGASSSGFSGTVYEPDDEYKGDIARAIMYMAIRYATASVCKKYGGSANSYPVTTWNNAMFSGNLSTNYGLSANAVAMYMKWHRADPPSAKEIARNNGVEVKQGNRNPFVDLPDLAEYLWGTHAGETVSLSSLDLATGGGAVATPYEITLNRNGATQKVTCTGTYTLPTAGEETAACEGWPFVGWTTSSSVNSTTAPTFTTQTTGATTLYAVYGNTVSSAPKRQKMAETVYYTKVTSTDDVTSGEYLIVYENGSKIFDGSLTTLDATSNNQNVTISDGKIESTTTIDGYAFTITKGSTSYTIQSASGYYIGATSNSNSLNSSTSTEYTNSISISSGNANIVGSGGAYLRYNNTSGQYRFRFFKTSSYSSQQAIQLYKKSSSGGGGGGSTTYMTSPTCGDPHNITLTNNGIVTGGEFDASASSAYAGATITLSAEPSTGYSFGVWTVTKQGGGSVTVTDNQFTMPDANVTVSATFNALPTYSIRFYNNGSQIGTTQSIYAGGYPDIPSDPTGCEGYSFVGWWTAALAEDNTTSQTWITDFTVTQDQSYYAVFEHTVTSGGGGITTKTDELTRAFTERAATSTYGDWSDKTGTSGAIYAGNSAGDHDAIQLRSNNSNSGIITTTSGGKVTKVTLVWESNTQSGRTINIYGKNTAYSAASDLYGSNAGTKIGSIVYGTSTELTISDEYTFIGIRSNSGALYLTSVSFTWSSDGGGSSTTYYTSTTNCTVPCSGTLTTPNVTATPGDGKITLTWADVTNADHYTVTIGTGAGYTTECGSAASIGAITHSGSTNTCVITGLTNGLEYTTSVVANGTSVCDSEADEDQTTPMDCTPWTDPTLTYNKYNLNTTTAQTATLTIGGTTHGNVSFESSNTDVLTVASNGTVTAVGAGTATVTAHWTAANGYCEKSVISSLFTVAGPLTIHFDANGGNGTMTNQTVTYNVAEAIKANTFELTGYSFSGWATSADGEKVYDDQQSVAFTNSQTLYALWQINSHNVTFTPSPAGATVTVNSLSTSPQSAEYGSTVTIHITPAEHYIISTVTVTGATSGSIAVTGTGETRTFTMPDEDVTVTVTMSAESQYTATFYDNGVSFATQSGYVDDDITAPASTPSTCDGFYTFVGWVASVQATELTTHPELVTFPQLMPTGGLSYYALYSRSEGGSGGGSAGVTFSTGSDGTISYTSDSDIKANVVESYSGISEFVGNRVYTGSHGIKLGSSKGTGYVTLTLSSPITTNQVTVVASKYGSDTGKLKVEVNGDNAFGEALSPADGTLVFTNTSAVEISDLTVSTTSARAYVASISLGSGGTAYYTTSPVCSGYTITVEDVEHGSGASDKNRCDEGGTVAITLTPDEGYECGGITTEPVVSTTETSECTYTFSMPGSDITVTPVFTPKTPRTFTFDAGTGTCATTELTESVWNAGITLPTATANSGCEPEYVFAGWATVPVSTETGVRPTLYPAGTLYNEAETTLYAVYSQSTGAAGFTISYTYSNVTYYVATRTGNNTYMDATTDIAEAAHFSIVTSDDKQYLCWHNETVDTYISSTKTGSSTKTQLSFATDLSNATDWTVTETETTIILESNGGESRHFMFNTNQKDRFAAYADNSPLNKGSLGTTVYHTFPSCVCTSVDITYDANGGTLDEGCSNVTGGECERDWMLCDAPTRDSYLFTGWKDQSGKLYNAGATVTNLKTSLTLTAQWIEAPYTVLFDAGTGTCVESLTETNRGEGIVLPKAEPAAACAEDWTFIGWSATKLSEETTTPATIIGVAGVEYMPGANNTTLYAVYRKIEDSSISSDYTRVTEATPEEGDYLIVLAKSEESFGLLTYGTITSGRLVYNETYTELPASISSPDASQIWHLTYDAEGYAYLYNTNAGAYLAASGYNMDYNAYAGSAFRFTQASGSYGDYQCLNHTASSSTNYYLGVNKEYDLIRYYGNTTLISTYSVSLYRGSAGTRYYSTEPECTPCIDPEWSFELGTNVVKSKGSAPFTNTVNKAHESAGTVTYSSTNEAVATVNATTGEVTIIGTGTTTITLRLTRAMPYCAAVMQYELEVKEPSIDVVGVTADGEIIVEHDLDGTITIDLSEGHAVSTGTAANDIFFSKYFEAASHMKLFAIFNGTGHDMDISHIRVRSNCSTAGPSVWPSKTGDLGYVELSNVSKLREQYPKMKIPSGTELIFWSNNKGNGNAGNTTLRSCIEFTIGDMTYHYSDLEAGEVPNWFCLGNFTTYNKTDADGNNQFVFSGDKSLIMERYDESTGTWVAIDLFGAGTSEAPASTTGLVEQITTEYVIDGVEQVLNDGLGFHATCTEDPDEIPLSTNRYMLIRKNTVLDGTNAVASNTSSFATFCSEWDGKPVGGSTSGYCTSGEKFSDIGEYDYSENYTEWVDITNDQYTVVENADGTVTITFTGSENLDARACQLLKIEVRDETDPTKVLATSEYKIPIVVKAGEVLTSADLFHDKGDKCATCDVAIMGSATLTKATDGVTNDMPEVRDIYVYGGGNLVIPSGTHYNAHDLILRTEVANDKINMNVPNVQVSGSLTNQYGGSIRMQTRVGTTRFYQFAVPYTVRLEDVTFSDGTPAVYGEDFMIRYYDGEQRAANQGTASNWRNYEGTELYPGVGYTLAVAKKTGHEQRELIFPMASASLVEGEPATKTTTIYAWGDNSIRANHRGWNFLSNPYLTTYAKNNLDEDAGGMLTTGRLEPDPEHPGWWVNDEGTIPYVTIINPTRTDYSQEMVSLHELPPFATFFIQAGDNSHNSGETSSLTFDRTHRKTSAPAYIRAEQKSPVARFGVLLNGNNAQDNCGMVIGDDYSAVYDMQADLSKEFGSAYSLKLYTLQEDDMPMAFMATHPDSLSKPVPVGVRLPANTEYTFAIDRRYNLGAFDHIYLTDNVTGRHTDLLEDTYSFSGTKQQNNTRFCLFVQLRHNVPTGTDNLLNGIYAVGRDGSVMLTGLPETAVIYIYDMNGRMVLTRHTEGATSVTYSIPSGVYQIRVQSEGANALLRTIVY